MTNKKDFLKSKGSQYAILYGSLLLYSMVFVFYKLVSQSVLYYLLALMALGLYAALWQQILKKMPLVTAYANKGIVIIYGMFWGKILFHEAITWNMILGSILIIFGMVIVAKEQEEGN